MEPVSGNDHIHGRIAALIRDICARSPAVDTAIDEITAAASEFVPGAQYAGVTVAARHNDIQTLSASGRYPRLLDMIQNRHQQGPCLEAIHEQRTVRVDDLNTEIRWPNYRQDALSQTPIRSVLSFTMSANRHTLGALNFCAEQPHAFDARAEGLGFVYATHAALAWNSLRRDHQFRRALATRDVISQAKGMLMERYKISSDEAFDRLRELSQNSNVPVTEISRGLIDELFA
jgi:transcriptional regulator with GAF, ATPase, and Fis domain